MRFSDLLTMSVNNLFRRKLRTFLTVLGVVIGTASIVVMVSIGIGLKEFTIKQYSSYGSLTAIQVYNYDNGNSSDKKNPEDSFMTDETMKTFEKIPHVTSAYPDLNLNVIMRQGVYEGNVQLHGIPLGAMKNIKLGEGSLILDCYPAGKFGVQQQAERLGRPFLYLPGSFDYEEIQEQERQLVSALEMLKKSQTNEKLVRKAGNEDKSHSEGILGITGLDIEKEIQSCEAILSHAKEIIGDTPVALDYLFHPRPLGLAKLLLTHGFKVESVYLDSISPEEKEIFFWLKENVPELKLISTIRPEMRVRTRCSENKILAIGQKAAWFTGSRNFVNMVQGGGLYGFDGIRHTAQLMIEAFETEKNPEDLIVRKGWGCESCI